MIGNLLEKMNTFSSKEIIISAVFLVALLTLLIIGIRFLIKHREPVLTMDTVDGLEFEHYCADLLEKRGFLDVTVTPPSKDFGVDILAEKDGITYGIQCKAYTSTVGVKAVQEAYAGKDFYDRMVGVVMTNQYFTSPAVEAATKLKILLWDRGYLEEMLREEE